MDLSELKGAGNMTRKFISNNREIKEARRWDQIKTTVATNKTPLSRDI